MKKQLTISLFVMMFLFSSVASFASFPVKKSVTTNDATTSISVDMDQQDSATAYDVLATTDGDSGKSQLIALILCVAVGGLGIHRFYLGYMWQGVVQLLTAGGFGIWWLIDLINLITGKLTPKDGAYTDTL